MVERKRFSAFTSVAIGPEQRRLRLIGAVGAPETLNGGVGLPAGFEQVMDTQALVPRRQVRVIAAAGAAGVGEDEDALQVIHEGGGLGEIRGRRAVLDGEAVARTARALAHDAARAACHLGHHVRAEALHDLVERAGNGRQAMRAARSVRHGERRLPDFRPAGRRGRPAATTDCPRCR